MAEISLREYIRKIEDFIRDARLDEAIGHSGHILKKFPKNAAVYRDLGRALMRKQRYEEAGEIFRRLLAAVPDDFSSHYQLSIVYENTNKGDAALWHIERAFDQQPNNANVNERMRSLYKKFRNQDIGKIQLTAGAVANQYIKARMYNEAIELLRRTLAKSPDRVDLRLLLAKAYWDSGEIIDAAEASIEVLKLAPFAVEANRILTELWLDEDRPSDAQRYLSRLEDIDPYLAYEIATNAAVPDEQFMLEELDYKQYAVSLTSQQSPDWLDSLGDFEEEPVEEIEEPTAEKEVVALEEAPETDDTDWLSELDDIDDEILGDSEEAVQSADLSDIFGDDFGLAEEDDDELEALLGDVSDEGDDWLADIMADNEPEADSETEKVDTGGLLGKLGITDDETEDDDNWLQDVQTGRFDTGPLRDLEDILDSGEVEEEATAPDMTMRFDDIPSEAALDSLEWVDDIDDDEDIIVEEGDPMAWLEEAGIDLDDEEETTSTDIHRANDPMAWMQDTGIEFDDEAINPLDSLFEDDEPTTLETRDSDPLAWLGETDVEVNQTGELESDEDEASDPLAWMNEAGIELDDDEDFIAEEAIDDPMAWMDDAGLEVDDELEPENEKSTTDQLAWLQDDSVLDEMLDLASLTSEHPAVGEFSWDSSTSEEEDWEALSAEDEEDMGMDWLDDEGDDLEQADDPMAWMNDEEDDLEQADDPMAWMNDEEDDLEQADDPMAWMNEEDGLEFDEATEDKDYSIASAQDMTRDFSGDAHDFSGDAEADELPDFLSEVEEESQAKTGMLDFLNADASDADVAEDWLSDFDAEETFEEEADWLSALDEDVPESEAEVSDWVDSNDDEEALDWTVGDEEAVASEADWLSDMSDEQNDEFDGLEDDFDFGTEESEEEPVAAEADWLSDLDDSDDDFDFGDEEEIAEEEPVAAEADWLSDLDDSDDDFDFGDDEIAEEEPVAAEADWLSDLGDSEDDFDFGDDEIAEEEPVAAEADWLSDLGDSEDDFDFGTEEEIAEEEPVAAEADWLSDLDDSDDDFDFGDEEEIAEEEPVAAEADWLSDLGDSEDDFDFGTEEEIAEEEPIAAEADWLSDLDDSEDDFDFGDEEEIAEEEPVAAEADWLSDLDDSEDDFDFGDDEIAEEEPVAAEADWLSDLGDTSADEEFNFGEEDEGFTQEEAESVADEFFASLGIDDEPAADSGWGDLGETGMTGDLETADDSGWGDLGETGMTGDLEPAADSGWGDLGETGMTGDLETADDSGWGDLGETGMTGDLETADDSGWGDLGETGMTGDLEPTAEEGADWGNLGETGMTTDLEPTAEDGADWGDLDDDEDDDWLAGIGVQEPEPEPEEIEDINLPTEPSGLSDLVQAIRTTRETGMLEIDDDELDDEPQWLDTIDEIPAISDDMIEETFASEEEFVAEIEEEEDAPEPLSGGAIAGIDWSDLGTTDDDAEFYEEEIEEPVQEFAEAEFEDDSEWDAQSVEFSAESDEELEQSDASNAPDWLNAMVPGLDLDFEAEEDAPVDEAYDERETSFRGRSLNEGATVDDFAWLNSIVEQETGRMEAFVDEEEEFTSSPPPPPMGLREIARFVFSKLPVWTQKAAQSENIAPMELPDYMSDFDDESDLDFDDEFDDDFEFEDFEDDFD